MDLTEAKEHRSAGELDDETMARKRWRRVSFAETTAVHDFDRDEDSETSPSSGAAAPSPAPASEPFQGDNSDSDDDDEDDGEQKLFVRDMDSPSPGSAMGSVTSNDDDNFFGPVSASFIRSWRLSKSGMSEDNEHDVTLDSTAFSLHFHNVVPPDDRSLVGSIGTPVTDDEVYTNSGGSAPQGFRKRILEANLSDGGKSGPSSMSLVVENPNQYDYGKMSPRLEALLAEVDRSMKPNSPNNDSSLGTSSRLRSEVAEVKESRVGELHTGKSVELNDMTDNDCLTVIEDQIDEGNHSHAMQASPPLAITTTGDTQVARNKVDSMRQELEMLDQKVKILVKYFESLCNIKENMDCNEIINVVNEHLEATNSCRNFCQDLQLWELSDIVKKNNQSDIVLNYRNLLFQRLCSLLRIFIPSVFTMNNGPISSIAVSNLLKDANIDKRFPNMNACLAFEFVFKAKDDRRMAALMCLQQEIFVTNLLMGTILEMFEEV